MNLPDHCPVIMDLYVNDSEKPIIKGSSNNSGQELNFRWDKEDIFQYYHIIICYVLSILHCTVDV